MAIDFDQLSALLTPDGGRIDVAGSAFETFARDVSAP